MSLKNLCECGNRVAISEGGGSGGKLRTSFPQLPRPGISTACSSSFCAARSYDLPRDAPEKVSLGFLHEDGGFRVGLSAGLRV